MKKKKNLVKKQKKQSIKKLFVSLLLIFLLFGAVYNVGTISDVVISWVQEKSTNMHWLGADDWLGISSTHYSSSCGSTTGHTIQEALDGDDYWWHTIEHTHYFILDLGQTYTIKKVRGRSSTLTDPIDVNIYIDDNNPPTTLIHETITTWQDTGNWVEIDITDSDGRYIKVEIEDTEDAIGNSLQWGDAGSPFAIFDAYGDTTAPPPPPPFINNASNASFPVPNNHSISISPQPICNITITDQDGNISTCNFYTSTDNITWTWVQINTSILNESISFNYTSATSFNTKYYWNVTVEDEHDNVSFYFDFTTRPINTSVNTIIPYNQTTSPLVITATNITTVDNVTLYYRYSTDNASWDTWQGWNHTVIITKTGNDKDGWVNSQDVDTDWSAVRNNDTGLVVTDDQDGETAGIDACWSNVNLFHVYRSFLYFDTSAIPDNAVITNVTLMIYGGYELPGDPKNDSNVTVQKGKQNDTLTVGDYSQFSGSYYDIAYFWSLKANYFYFNEQGQTDINKTGTTKLCLREYWYDYRDVEPPKIAGMKNRNGIYYNENTNLSRKPRLNITYTSLNPDTSSPWSWDFDFPNNTGYYEFYSIGKKNGSPNESAPSSADTRCYKGLPPPFINNASNASFPIPNNHSISISPQPICNITITDQDGNISTCNFYTSTDNITWTWVQINTSILNESISFNYTSATSFNTKYYWNVTVEDEHDNVSFYFDFTTHTEGIPPWTNTIPTATYEIPVNISTDICKKPTVNITIIDIDGNLSNVSFYTSPNGIAWTFIHTNVSILNISIQFNYSVATANDTLYYWKIQLHEENESNLTYWFTFKTVSVTLPYYTKGEIDEMLETTIISLSNPLLLILLWIVMLWIAHKKDESVIYWLQMGFGLPLGIYFLWLATTVELIPNLAGLAIILISIYYVFVGTALYIKRSTEQKEKK